jgi:hypothetical protein
MLRIEVLAIAIGNLNGGYDTPESRAFQNANPGLLKTYRPEKKADSEHLRIFSSILGGTKALIADLQSKCSGKNHRLSSENTLRDLLAMYGFNDERAIRRITVFLQKSLNDENIYAGTKISWLLEMPKDEESCLTNQ